jgi:hypothetical protein
MTDQTTNKARDSFIMYRSFIEATNSLQDVDRLQIFDAIFSYALDAKESNLTGISHTVFTLIKPQLDANRKRFQNGSKDKKKSKPEAKTKQKRSKREANKNVNDNVNDNKNKNNFTPPTLQQIQDYCKERNNQIDPDKFFDYYSAGNWSDAKGNKIKNWKQKLITWENKTTGGASQPDTKNLCNLINKMAGASYLTAITIVNNKAMLHFKSLADYNAMRMLENIQEIKNKISSELGTDGIETDIRS